MAVFQSSLKSALVSDMLTIWVIVVKTNCEYVLEC